MQRLAISRFSGDHTGKKKPHTQRKASMGVLESGHGLRHGLLFQNAMDSVKWMLAYNL